MVSKKEGARVIQRRSKSAGHKKSEEQAQNKGEQFPPR